MDASAFQGMSAAIIYATLGRVHHRRMRGSISTDLYHFADLMRYAPIALLATCNPTVTGPVSNQALEPRCPRRPNVILLVTSRLPSIGTSKAMAMFTAAKAPNLAAYEGQCWDWLLLAGPPERSAALIRHLHGSNSSSWTARSAVQFPGNPFQPRT